VNNRQLLLMDKSGTKTKIDDTRGVFSPSWSDDGRRLAWVEVRGKKATVKVATVEHK
jgi:Tol biopolymer transport system component